IPEPRQIVFDLYLTYGVMDDDLAKSLIANLQLEPDRCVLLSSSSGLFARSDADFIDLESDLSRCAAAAVLLTPTMLTRMEEGGKRTELVIETLRARSGSVLGLAAESSCIERAAAWQLTKVIDISGYGADQAAVARQLKPLLRTFGAALSPAA